jgi:prevent-host-death family protein
MKIEQIGTLEAKTRLSELLDKVERGQRFQITRHGKPVAELSPVVHKKKKRRFGCGKGLVSYISADFDEPLEDFKDYMQ